ADYNETLTRKDFIDPFFKALGWDMDNSNGYAEAYREVIHEDKIKIAGATKAPDYSFRLPGGKRLFFVEAKKPSVAVKDDVLPAYQVRRYAWSAKLPVSILTDFEELAIYDCNKKPSATDKASAGRIKYLTYKDYLNEFDFIWDTFSKERVLKGSFDKFVAADKNKKGTATVDKEFLASLDEWRKQLALNIALRNDTLSEEELNFVVQQTLDRIIFLRIAEDRSVEEYGRLKSLVSSPNGGGQEGAYQNLFTYFKEADEKYNSGLFDFQKDKLSKTISIDNKVIKTIINELYYPISPYEFSVLSVEILGSAYEQFLGKQIKLTAGHRAAIEEKPEVRKAGGVYYTPQYIVDYIVQHTVGTLCAGKTPEQVAKLRITDPACGSGSFLLGAYQYLLHWHLDYYKPGFEQYSAIAQNSSAYTEKQRSDAIKQRNKLPLTPDGNLTTAIKKQILLNNIYGVDIDTQAVEVTKLSLLLKCMEGETGSSVNAELRFGERLLPTLDNNIKCGNSLVDVDFYDGQLDFEPATEKKIKPFSWQQAFPAVFKQG
ncbi:MAG: N-6 DNA methylase, partial [Bacteroidetes bacterium]|nr:N-6 DNA methylase [Bacteroidota bacterium]